MKNFITELPVPIKLGTLIAFATFLIVITNKFTSEYNFEISRIDTLEESQDRQNKIIDDYSDGFNRIRDLEKSSKDQNVEIEKLKDNVSENKDESNRLYRTTNGKLNYIVGVLEEMDKRIK